MKRVVGLVVIMLAGAVIGVLGTRLIRSLTSIAEIEVPPLGWLLVGFLGISFVIILLHELGHVAGGLLAGFTFFMLVVGPVKLVREGEALRFRLNTSLNVGGGLALLLPTNDRVSIGRMALYIAGGPVASLLVAVLFGLLTIMLGQASADGTLGMAGFFSLLAALMSLVIGLATLLPLPSKGFATDGTQLLDLLRGGTKTQRKLLVLAVIAESMRGARPRTWAPERVEQVLALSNGVADQQAVVACLLGYYHWLDRGEAVVAGPLLDRALANIDHYPKPLHAVLCLEAAYFEARHRHDAEAARALLDQAGRGFAEKQSRARAEAATLWAEGQHREAMEVARRGLHHLPKALDQGSAAAEKDWLEALLRESNPVQP